jgi:hypothetical protein
MWSMEICLEFVRWLGDVFAPIILNLCTNAPYVLSVWILVMVVRKRPRGDELAYGLIKALYLIGILISERELIHSYFTLGGLYGSFAFVAISNALTWFLVFTSLTFALTVMIMLRYRSQPQLSVLGLLGIAAPTAALTLHIIERIAWGMFNW